MRNATTQYNNSANLVSLMLRHYYLSRVLIGPLRISCTNSFGLCIIVVCMPLLQILELCGSLYVFGVSKCWTLARE
jgi:hypothetical protein